MDIILDFKCRRCIMCQERFDLKIDCRDCKYYWERVAKGEIEDIEIEMEKLEEE